MVGGLLLQPAAVSGTAPNRNQTTPRRSTITSLCAPRRAPERGESPKHQLRVGAIPVGVLSVVPVSGLDLTVVGYLFGGDPSPCSQSY